MTWADRNIAKEFAENPEGLKKAAVEAMLPYAIQATIDGCKNGKRWAVLAALRVAKWIDVHQEVSVVMRLAQEFNLTGEEEIRQRLLLASRAQTVGLDEAQDRAVDLLRRIREADPQRAEAIRAGVFGAVREIGEGTR